LERDKVRAARCLPTTCLLLGILWKTEVIMVYVYACKISDCTSAIGTRRN
jgi:hypothetical protein